MVDFARLRHGSRPLAALNPPHPPEHACHPHPSSTHWPHLPDTIPHGRRGRNERRAGKARDAHREDLSLLPRGVASRFWLCRLGRGAKSWRSWFTRLAVSELVSPHLGRPMRAHTPMPPVPVIASRWAAFRDLLAERSGPMAGIDGPWDELLRLRLVARIEIVAGPWEPSRSTRRRGPFRKNRPDSSRRDSARSCPLARGAALAVRDAARDDRAHGETDRPPGAMR
jgi:hypothetical protein